MTTGESEMSGAARLPNRRLLVAIAGGLIAMMVALGGVIVDLSASRAQLQSQLDENRRTINALTKQLYWAEQQLEQSR